MDMTTVNELHKPPAHAYGLIIFALVTLFNPCINVVDILPDFIGYFILASFFLRGADTAPHFEEAAISLRRMGILSLCKIPAIFIIAVARGQNTMDNDVIALMAVTFAALEITFSIPAIKSSFSALFYLGERTDAAALIKNDKELCSDSLLSLSYLLTVLRCVSYALPEVLRLTRDSSANGGAIYVTGSNYYPYALLIGVLLTATVGIAWLVRMIKYVRYVRREGKFYSALDSLVTEGSLRAHELKLKKRSVFRSAALFTTGAVLCFNLTFSDFEKINLIPPFISVILFTLAALGFLKHAPSKRRLRSPILVTGIIGAAVSLTTYVFEIIFASKYGYDALLYGQNPDATAAYDTVFILSLAEFAFTTAVFLLFFAVLYEFIKESLGEHPKSQNYRITDKKYHERLFGLTKKLTVISIVSAFIRLAEVFLDGKVMMILTDSLISASTSIITSVIPWFSLVVTAANLTFVLYSAYYFSTLKDEAKEYLH
jgi:hypothetical protein